MGVHGVADFTERPADEAHEGCSSKLRTFLGTLLGTLLGTFLETLGNCGPTQPRRAETVVINR